MTDHPSGDAGTLPGPSRLEERTVRLPGGRTARWPALAVPVDHALTAALGRLGPAWELELAADEHHSMAVWDEAIDRFAAALAADGPPARRVVRRRLRVPPAGAVRLAGPDPAPGARSRLTLVFTDGGAPGWANGVPFDRLRQWAAAGAVAVVHMLPQSMWRRWGLPVERLRLYRADDGPVRNATLIRDPADTILTSLPGPVVPVPVLELGSSWMETWVRLLTGPGTADAHLACLLLPATPAAAPPAAPPGPASDPITAFRSAASPPATQLATRLAAAAPLNLDVMRLLQATLLPRSEPAHLAEILVAGLIQPVAPDPAADSSGLVTHDFIPGARAELLTASPRADTLWVARILDSYLGDHVPAIRRMAATLDDPDRAGDVPVAAGERLIAEVHATVLRALTFRYRQPAALIQAQVDRLARAESPGSGSAAAPDAVEDDMTQTQEPEPARLGTAGPTPPRPAVRVPTIWGNVPPRNPNFTGRAEVLDQLKHLGDGEATAVLPEALHGMGGVGKTQVVIEYVYRNSVDYDVVWWIPAERPAQIASSMVDLAQKLGLPVKAEAAAIPAVREALRIGVPYQNWLLVFDNADSPETVRQYFPMDGPGRILVTSRNPLWSAVARAVEVDVFRREESITLLTRRAPTLSREQADNLAAVLGDLPLAIEQAGAWLAETGMQAKEYLRLFQDKQIALLEMSPPPDYQLPVAAAWNVSLDHLARTRPAALRLLQLCALMAPEPISRSLFSGDLRVQISPELDTTLRDPIQLNRAIREINRYALARIDHAKNTIQMHRLVQAVLIERMTPEERAQMRRGAHQVLASNDPRQPTVRESWPQYGELYPHLSASKAITDAEQPWVRDLVINEAKYHSHFGNAAEALEIAETAYRAWGERIGEEDVQTLQIGRWYGYTLFTVGRYAEAAELNAHLREIYQRRFGPEHEETLEADQAVASDLRVKGRFKDSLELSQDVYDRCVRLFDVDDPLTLNAAHNLAVSLRLAGRFEAARRVDQDTYDRKVQVFGQNHEETLRAMRGVLIDRRQLGDYLTSREEFERLAGTFAESLGERDPQTVETLRSLSVTRRKAGDHAKALETSAYVFGLYESDPDLGPDNPTTMQAALNLSLDLRQADRMDEAAEVATDNFHRFRAKLGKLHPHTLASGGNLAIIHRLKGELDKALRLNSATLDRLREALGEEHVLTLSCATNMASDLFADDRVPDAYELDRPNLERYRAVMGDDHPSTLAAALNVAIDLRALGRTEAAYELHSDTLNRYHEVLGGKHPATRDAARWERANCDMDVMPL
ncbi:FxSxx-COOH system tetratricopeptide repeat protein [Actinoplanes teichomyceticus]|uniref:Tetratricopeptide repeat protein n=1 Tax=Actinoplanes teichomyceticus TaxID=1867 RepID=A0A561W9X1_ACTTI|nr:FxSxx-COOH system tetratricopeptide repeat protein [Actinoplanes teichomyceticus]TWG20664.1 tetratricopeptide repeat protein [Actinoplanes teichomyceticus]GIF14319.1 cytochrome c [Actinoplanes teichomyceticus]